jgi:hypothetical protein
MRTESGQMRQDAFLCPCPRCAAHNALNAARCWRCETELPPPSADALIAAYAALAIAREARPASPARLPEGWRLHTSTGATSDERASPPAATDAAPPAHAPPAAFPTASNDAGPPHMRTIAMGDEDDDEAEPPAGGTPVTPRPPWLDPTGEEAAALARRTAVTERFGAFAERAEAASRRRHVFGLTAAVLGTVLILAGYPIYRSTERTLGATDLRRTPPPPGWPQAPAAAPARAPSTTPLMTQGKPATSALPQTANARSASLGSSPSPAPRSVEATGTTPVSMAAHGERLPHVAHSDRTAKRKATPHPLVLPPATSRELAALASGR